MAGGNFLIAMLNVPNHQRWDVGAESLGHDRAEETLNAIGDAVLSTDVDGNVVYLNAAAEAMTGWDREAAAGRPLGEVFRLVDRETRAPAPNSTAVAVQLDTTVELAANGVLVRRDGREVEIEDSAAPIHDKNGHVTGAVIVFRDVGRALQMSRRMSHLAQHDVLTGLPNRLLLSDRLTAAIALARRHHKALAVLFVDVDEFKAVNDVLGHVAGDGVLQSVARRLTHAVRESDTVCRYGGDEFVIVLPEIEHAEDVAVVERKLVQAIRGPHCMAGEDVVLTASIGIGLYPNHGRDADTLIAHADVAMYDAKRARHSSAIQLRVR
jgi:diguanylate cyclase (GGDEF)-like protein/PAS domain S-box-containing protein